MNNQRTKGNVRPSNSERASRLLTTNKFVSFSEASKNLSSIYSNNNSLSNQQQQQHVKNDDKSFKQQSAFDCEIDKNFQQIFKHMAKKDLNTKIKALEEFMELCRQKQSNELINITRFWFRIYKKLANSIEWNVRHSSHEAQLCFLRSIDRNSIYEYIELSSDEQMNINDSSDEISFQTLITMPSVLWNSCFDAYGQPCKSARNIFTYLYPKEMTIKFLLKNYDAILNYYLYFLFNRCPIELFYNTQLPSDSIQMFNDNQHGICLHGLSTMINELLNFYIQNNDDDDVYKCLEKIFIKFNEKFGQCKGFLNNNKTVIQNQDQKMDEDTLGKQMEQIQELELSKKEKKKLQSKKNQQQQQQLNRNDLKKNSPSIWNCMKSNNDYVRIATYQALISFTKLTIFFNAQENNNYLHNHNLSTKLWFKLYKSNFFPTVMNNGFIDSTIEIRGLSWLIASNLLSNNNLFNLWSIINCNDWLQKILQPFVLNGMKSIGSIIDFGIDRIGLKMYSKIFNELSSNQFRLFSARKLSCPASYEKNNFNDKINIVIILIESFNQSQLLSNGHNNQLLIYDIFLTNLLKSFNNVTLTIDLLYLIELFFNIACLALEKCMMSSNNIDNQQKQLMIETICQHLNELLLKTIKNDKSSLQRCQIYMNNLLLINNVKKMIDQIGNCENFKLFEMKLQSIYEEILKLDNYQSSKIRLLTESFYQFDDNYFSNDYYINELEFNYEHNLWRLLKQQLQSNKQVKFEQQSNHNAIDYKNLFENIVMINHTYNHPPSLNDIEIISLIDLIPSLEEQFFKVIIELIANIDQTFETKSLNRSKSFQEFENEFKSIFMKLLHLHYIIRSKKIHEFLSNMESTKLYDYLTKWLMNLYEIGIESSDNDKLIKYRYLIMIGSKICDNFIVYFNMDLKSKINNKIPVLNLNPFAYCIVKSYLNDMKKIYHNIPESYKNCIEIFAANIDEQNDLSKIIHEQISKVFQKKNNENQIETIILSRLIAQMIESFNSDDNDQQKDEKLKSIYEIIINFFNNYEAINIEIKSDDEFFINDFPILSMNLYEIIVQNSRKLFLFENFEQNFLKHSNIFLQKFAQTFMQSDNDDDKMLKFIDNIEKFITKIRSKLNEQNYDQSFMNEHCLSLLKFIINEFIFTSKIIECNEMILKRLKSFMIILLKSLVDNDDENMIYEFLFNLNEKFHQDCHDFENENNFSILFDLYGLSPSKSANFYQSILQFLNYNDRVNEFTDYMSKMSKWNVGNENNEQYDRIIKFMKINSIILTILIESNLLKSEESLMVMKRLLRNYYLLEIFILVNKKWSLFKEPSNKIDSIFNDFKSKIDQLIINNDNDNWNNLISKLFESFKQDNQNDFAFLSYFIEKYNVKGKLYVICEMKNSKSICTKDLIQLIETNDMEMIDQTLHRFIEPYKIVEIVNNEENNEKVIQRLMNFDDLNDEIIHKLLLTISISLQKLTDTNNESIQTNVIDTIKSLSESNFCGYIETLKFSTFSNENESYYLRYQIIYMTTYLLETLIENFLTSGIFCVNEFNLYFTIYKHCCQSIFSLDDELLTRIDIIILISRIFKSMKIFIYSTQQWIQQNKHNCANDNGNDNEIGQIQSNPNDNEIIEIFQNFLAYNSMNLLLPFYVHISDLFYSNETNQIKTMYKELMLQLSNILLLLDQECLNDMALFELNQSLLLFNENSLFEKRLCNLLEQLHDDGKNDNKINYLQTNNDYYDYILEHVTPLLLKNDYNIIYTAYHLISITCQSVNWSSIMWKNVNGNENEQQQQQQQNSNHDMEITNLTLSHVKNQIQNNNDANDDDDDDDDYNKCYYPPKIMMALLESLFASISIDDLHSSSTATYAYLLIWTIYLRLLQQFPYNKDHNGNEIRTDLINYLVEKNLHSKFFENLFLLMHDSIDWDYDRNYLQPIIQSINNNADNDNNNNNYLDCLNDSNRLLKLIEMNDNELDHSHYRNIYLAIFVYYQSLCNMSNVVRCWYNSLRHNQKELVDYVTRRYFSKLLMEKELDLINNVDHKKLGNIQIKFSRKLNEISAIYSLKEISFGIRFTFESNYPLTTLSINCFDKSGVSEDVCRKWLQRLIIFFNRMNCSILDGIIMIKPNMDKLFEGMEECMICLYVLYGINGQLPRFKCPQCRKKFHTICMRKWFQTHHSAICPMCKFEFQ